MVRALLVSLRRLAAQPAFAVTAVATLALGIGASTAIYSIAYGVLLRPLPFPDAGQLVEVRQVGDAGAPMRFSRANFEDVAADVRQFAGLARYATSELSVVHGRDAVRVVGTYGSAQLFDVMAVPPAVGRGFSPPEVQPGGPAAVVVSHAYWRDQLAGRTDVLGTVLRIGDTAYPVVGIMPPGFDFPNGSSLWLSADRTPRTESRTAHNWQVVGRLRPEASVQSVAPELTAVAQRLKATYADDTWMADAVAVPLRDTLVGDAGGVIVVLAGAVGFLLLVSCATVTNLLLVQGVLRAQEFAVRQAVGATWLQLLRQLLTEHLVLVALGGAAGVWLAVAAVRGLLALDPGLLPLRDAIGVDGSALSFALGLVTALALLLGLTSAIRLLHDAPVRSLGAVGRGAIGGRGVERMRQALVVLQVAFTLMLLVGAMVLGQRLLALVRVDPGFHPDPVLVAAVTLPADTRDRAEAGAARARQLREVVDRLTALGPVTAAGGITALPLTGRGSNGMFLEMLPDERVTSFEDFAALGKLPGRSGSAEYRAATPGYFETLQIPLRRGRLFADSDVADGPHVAVVNETLARQRWPDADPIGRLLQFGNMDGDLRPLTIVGVVADTRDASLDGPPRPTIYANATQRATAWGAFSFVIRGAAEPLTLAREARTTIAATIADAPVETRPLAEVIASTYGRERFSLLVVLAFALSSLLLAAFGVYGVSSYAVSSRTREFGVRMVLGAAPRRIVGQVLREGLAMVAVGTAIGVGGAVVITRLLASLIAGLGSWSASALMLGIAVVGISALAACLLPARRAARIAPAVALRNP